MKSIHVFPRLRNSVLAVHGALALIGAAHAQSDAATMALVQPTSSVEIGVGLLQGNRAKASEYSGIDNKRYLIADFDLVGGAAFDSDAVDRWSITGRDLGTRSRSLSAEVGQQGRWRLRLNADELESRGTDTLHSPYVSSGAGNFTLPSTWKVPLVPRVSATAPNARGLSPDVTASPVIVAGALVAPTAAQASTAAAIQAADLPLFGLQALGTQRQTLGLGGEMQLGGHWTASVSGSHEHKEGAQALSAITRVTGGDISTVLPQPIDEDHDQYRVGASYAHDGSAVRLAYDASLFSNHVDSVSWAAWSDPTKSQSMGTAPNNQFHKLSASASHDIDATTHVQAALGYSRSTQNASYLDDGKSSTTPLPQSSLNGLVVSQNAMVKLAKALDKQWQVNAAFRYDDRDNQTAVNTYGYYDAGEARGAAASVWGPQYSSNINLNANRPYSKRSRQWELDTRYRLSNQQEVSAGLQTNSTDKYCHGSWYNCADAAASHENTVHADWRSNAADEISGRVSLVKSLRKVNYDENAFLSIVPMANVSPNNLPATVAPGTTAYSTLVALGLTGYGPISGLTPAAAAGSAQGFFFPLNNVLSNALYGNENRISELVGMRHFNNADRDRNKIDGSLQWLASETLVLQAMLSLSRDSYAESVYGLQSASRNALNLEGNYSASDDLNIAVYAGRDTQKTRIASNSYTANSAAANVGGATAISGGCYATVATRNANNKIDPCLNWATDATDKVDSLGLALTRKNLLNDHLDLGASLNFSRARSLTDVSGGNYVNNPYAGAATATAIDPTIAAYYIAASALPVVQTDTVKLTVTGAYKLSEMQAIKAGVSYARLRTSEWAYEGLQPGTVTQVLPSYEQSPVYRVYGLAVSYSMRFK